MERKIGWKSYQLDEISLVYEKAEENESIMEGLLKLEEQALAEAAAACSPGGLFAAELGQVLTPEQFEAMPDIDKETAIVMLGQKGLADIRSDHATATITATLSSVINKAQACTIFGLLNRLEKLDGAVQIISPKWTLHLVTPLSGKKGLFQWEMLIMQLYPWLSVKETSSNILAEEGNEPQPAAESSGARPADGAPESDVDFIFSSEQDHINQYADNHYTDTRPPQPQWATASQGESAPGADAPASVARKIVCFLLPLIGFIMYFIHKADRPVLANDELTWASYGIIANIVLGVLQAILT